MNDEPVAWMEGNQKALAWVKEALINPIPLYTHPAKTLTDEEIYKLYEESYLEVSPIESEFDPIYFANAILRKSQEK